MSWNYKGICCYIRPIRDVHVGLSHWMPGVPYVQRYDVHGPGYVAWTRGIGCAYARKAKDTRRTLHEAIDKAIK